MSTLKVNTDRLLSRIATLGAIGATLEGQGRHISLTRKRTDYKLVAIAILSASLFAIGGVFAYQTWINPPQIRSKPQRGGEQPNNPQVMKVQKLTRTQDANRAAANTNLKRPDESVATSAISAR